MEKPIVANNGAQTKMRSIDYGEIKKVSRKYAEIFKNYRAYDLFFKRDCRQLRKIYYFYRYEIHVEAGYTYVSDDYKQLCSVRRPGDKPGNPRELLKKPFFIAAFYMTVGIRAAKLGNEYLKFAERASAPFYNPDTDCFILNIGVDKDVRGQGRLKSMINEFCGDMAIVLETHSEENTAIYKKLGFDIVCKTDFHGVTHYVMKRQPKA